MRAALFILGLLITVGAPGHEDMARLLVQGVIGLLLIWFSTYDEVSGITREERVDFNRRYDTLMDERRELDAELEQIEKFKPRDPK